MAKIAFDIKYRPEIESGKYKVVITDNNTEVAILKWDACAEYPIVVMFPNGLVCNYTTDGESIIMVANNPKLFILTDEPELTEFEQELIKIMKEEGSPIGADTSKYTEGDIAAMHSYSERLLALARKQLQPEIDSEIDKAYKNSDAVQYRRGKEDALKDMPHWRHMCAGAAGNGDGRNAYLIRDRFGVYSLSSVIACDYDYLVLAELDKLPKM